VAGGHPDPGGSAHEGEKSPHHEHPKGVDIAKEGTYTIHVLSISHASERGKIKTTPEVGAAIVLKKL